MARLSNQIMKENLEGFPGYHVTKTGNIFSNRSGKWVKLCTGLNPYGYVQVHLNKKTYKGRTDKKSEQDALPQVWLFRRY